ncbi:ATP-binding protein [Radicibacter daui]|uniref:ATP-binding protein n=1 Tax=Radicibacter daui TaxID=3064829 RepID=UPI004046E67D
MAAEPLASLKQLLPVPGVDGSLAASLAPGTLGEPAILIFDTEDRLKWWNRRFEDVCSTQQRDGLRIGATFRELLEYWLGFRVLMPSNSCDANSLDRRLALHDNYTGPFLENWGGGWLITSEYRLPEGGWMVVHTPLMDTARASMVTGGVDTLDLLAGALETVPSPALLMDSASGILSWNRRLAARVMGAAARQLQIGLPISALFEAMSGGGALRIARPLDEGIEAMASEAFDILALSDGQLVTPSLRQIGNGNMLVVFNELSGSAQRSGPATGQSLFEAASMPLALCRVGDGRILRANGAFAGLAGMEASALVGRPLERVWPGETVAVLAAGVRSGMVASSAEVAISHSGSILWFSVAMSHAQHHGENCMLLSFSDASRSRRALELLRTRERQLAAVVEAGQDGVFDIAPDSGVASFSPRFWTMLGFSEQEVLRAGWQMTSLSELVSRMHPQDAIAFNAELDRLLAGVADGDFNWMGRLRAPGDDWGWVVLRGRLARDGSVRRLLGISTDLTVQKKAEIELLRARDLAEAANRTKTAFLATMSHEMRTPMHGVLGVLELLADTALTDEQKDLVKLAQGSASGLLSVLDDILDYSTIEAGQLRLEQKVTDLPTLLQEAAGGELEEGVRRKGLTLALDVASPGVPRRVLCDPARVRQVVGHLLSNAVKFTREGGIILRLFAVPRPDWAEPGQLVCRMEVEDTGIGIPPAARDRLFAPFTQIDATTTRRFGGIGVGLTLCQRLVESMNGRIGVMSREGAGSLFWVELPFALVSDGSMTAGEPLAGARLLLAEAPDWCSLAELGPDALPGTAVPAAEPARERLRALHGLGGEAVMALSAGEALETLALSRPHLVLLDAALRQDDPAAFDRLIQLASPSCPVLLHGDGVDQVAAGDDILVLPGSISTGDLCAEAVGLLARSRRQQLEARRGMPVLVAEDMPAAQLVVATQLSRLGVQAKVVSNGLEALAALEEGEYGLVLTDLHMPEMDGYGFVAEWRRRERDRGAALPLPIVLLTADIPGRDQRQALAGVDDFLVKPVTRDTLDLALRRFGITAPAGAEALAAVPPALAVADIANRPTPVFSATMLSAEARRPAAAGQVPAALRPVAPPPIDAGVFGALIGDLGDPAIEILEFFAETTAAQMMQLEEMVSRIRAGEMVAEAPPLAHALKGAAASAGAMMLSAHLAAVQAALREGPVGAEDALSSMQAGRTEYERVLSYVADLRAGRAVLGQTATGNPA